MARPGVGLQDRPVEILGIRAAAEKQLGAQFDIRAFHDAVLIEGALPLAVLEARIKAWVIR